jgi:hypothetical protein
MHIQVDHTELKMEIQAEQVQWVFGGPQASSCEDDNIVVIKASPGAINQCPYLLFWSFALYFIFDCTLSYRSCMEP